MTMSKGRFAIGAIVGAVAGLITGILTAPKSGKETRADIKARAGEIKDEMAEAAETCCLNASDVAEDVKEKAQDIAQDIKTNANDLKERTGHAVEGAKKGFLKNK
jgi:gas vesicle protein